MILPISAKPLLFELDLLNWEVSLTKALTVLNGPMLLIDLEAAVVLLLAMVETLLASTELLAMVKLLEIEV